MIAEKEVPMQQLTFIRPGLLEWHEVAEPRLENAGDALVRPIVVTTCDLDGPTIRGETPLAGLGPFAFGHEFVAEVVSCGEQVSHVRPGQLVSVPFQISCGECDRCGHGLTANCRAVPSRSMFGFPDAVGGTWGGALSDLVRVPFAARMLLPLPSEIAPEAAASASDNLPDGWRTVGPQLGRSPGAPVLIVAGGAHSVALYAAAIAVALGSERVDFVDTDRGRLELAASFGAHPIEGPPPAKRGPYPITVDASANPAGLECALRSLEPGGTCTSVGIYYGDMTGLPLLDMYGKGVHFHTGRVNALAEMPVVLELIRSGKLHPERVTSEVVAWSDAAPALMEPSMKPIFVRS
jgi:threonine dehydrogenase-like Zn-dependent dehydrogenase